MRTYKLKQCKRIKGLAFSPDGTRLLVLAGVEAYGVETVVRLDLATGEATLLPQFIADHFLFATTPARLIESADAFAHADVAGAVRWLDPWAEADDWHNIAFGAKWPSGTSAITPNVLALTPDGTQLVVSFGQQKFGSVAGHHDWTYHLAVCPFDQPGRPTVTNLDIQLFSLQAAPDGKRWLSTYYDGRKPVAALSESPGAPPLAQFTPRGVSSLLGYLSFSPDGRFLAGAIAKKVFLLTADQLTLAATLEGHQKQVNALAFSPNGTTLLTAARDGAVCAWDVETGKTRRSFDWGLGSLASVTFSPDGLTCAAGSEKGQVVVWDVDE